MNELLPKARELFEKGLIEDEIKVLAEMKSLASTPMGTDSLRAKCFLALGKKYEGTARECLKEELRLNPKNEEAELLYNELFPSVDLEAYCESPKFQAIASKLSFHTMMPMRHLLNLFENANAVLRENIPGNFVEWGVAAGGSSALLGALIAESDSPNRRCYSFDTFSGMPAPGSEDRANGQDAQSSCWGQGTCSAPMESLLDACRRVGFPWNLHPEEEHPNYEKGICPVAEKLHDHEVICLQICQHDYDVLQTELVGEAFLKVWKNLGELRGWESAKSSPVKGNP